MRALLIAVAASMLLIATCRALLEPARSAADPLTYATLDVRPETPFPVVLIERGGARVLSARVGEIPPLPRGASYLVPAGREREIERELQRHVDVRTGGRWVLRVERLERQRQRIELYWMHDGYAGGVYIATASAIQPLYRKFTGPGFGIVVAVYALAMSVGIWAAISLCILAVRYVRRRRGRAGAEGTTAGAEAPVAAGTRSEDGGSS